MDPVAILARVADATEQCNREDVSAALDDWRAWVEIRGWKPEGYSQIVNRARRFLAEHERR